MSQGKSVVDEVRDLQVAIEALKKEFSELRRLSEFMQTMKDRGLLKKQEYDLPQIDTVGADPSFRPLSNLPLRLPTPRHWW